jgi:signal transduction histidine kinase
MFPVETFIAMMRPFGMEEALCFALRRGRDLVGFQACGYARQVDLRSHHFRIAQGMSQLASLALMNARLLEGLEQSNRLKDDFVNTMSHELRTPLHILIGYTEMLLDDACGPLAPAQTETLRRMHKTAQELFNLINAILDLSRLQDRRDLLTVSEIPLAIFLEELCSDVSNRYAKPAVTVAWEVDPSLLTLQTDAIKLQMVLKNLLVNALKFTQQGSVKVTAAAERGGVSFLVQDTGPGIPSEDLPFIFEPFRQGGPFSTRTHGGVGLGLYIVRQLMELLGGAITVDSEMGKGTTCYVWIPETPLP